MKLVSVVQTQYMQLYTSLFLFCSPSPSLWFHLQKKGRAVIVCQGESMFAWWHVSAEGAESFLTQTMGPD